MRRATRDQRSLTAADLLRLQRTLGNRAVQSLLVQGTQGIAQRSAANAVQRTLAGDLAKVDLNGFWQQIKGRGKGISYKQARELWEAAKGSETVFGDIGQVIATFENDSKYGLKPAEKPGDQPPTDMPRETVTALALASAEAQKEAVQEVSTKEAARPKVAPKQAKRHQPVDEGGSGVIINYVWLGSNKLGPLEKFNVYSWRALGHEVNIYTHAFFGDPVRTERDLDLEEGDANVIDLSAILGADREVGKSDIESGKDTPKAALGDSRAILMSWLAKIPQERGKAPSKDHIYNMVDLTKSYIGGTRRGIVLDMKVGPSLHLQDYAGSFNEQLISYTRGGNTTAGPENQSIGTMQESDELRLRYAKNFNEKAKTLSRDDVDKKWCDLITRYHGSSYEATRSWLDVATKAPSGQAAGTDLMVGEIGATSHGPFRVFKRADDQSNKGSLATKPSQQRHLAEDVWRQELVKSGGDPGFLEKAEAAMKAMPKTDT